MVSFFLNQSSARYFHFGFETRLEGRHTQSVSDIASGRNTGLDITVESCVVTETGCVGHGTLGVDEVVLKAGDLFDKDISFWPFCTMGCIGDSKQRGHTAQAGRPVKS